MADRLVRHDVHVTVPKSNVESFADGLVAMIPLIIERERERERENE
jgi:hypothetical protein